MGSAQKQLRKPGKQTIRTTPLSLSAAPKLEAKFQGLDFQRPSLRVCVLAWELRFMQETLTYIHIRAKHEPDKGITTEPYGGYGSDP